MKNTDINAAIELRQLLNERLPSLRLSHEQLYSLFNLSGMAIRNVLQAAKSVHNAERQLGHTYKPAEQFDMLRRFTIQQCRKQLESLGKVQKRTASNARPGPLTPRIFIEKDISHGGTTCKAQTQNQA